MKHVSWHQARELLHAAGNSHPAPVQHVPLEQAIDRYLGTGLRSPMDVPHYDSSAMDGYALRGAPPWQLITAPEPDEGENIHRRTLPLADSTATPILTGGLIPQGTEAILRTEHSQLTGNTLTPAPGIFTDPARPYPAPGADIRRAGEELTAGAVVATAGTRVTPRAIGAWATLGFDTLPVRSPATVGIAYTGNEVITSGLPAPGEVRDAFSPQFPRMISDLGGTVTTTARLKDSPQQISSWLADTCADILLVTGGSSTSDVDWVRRTLADLGATDLFESVTIRPGHPALAATLPGGILVLGLPGNPLAAHTALYSYLPAYLTGVYGLPLPALATGTLTAAVPGYRKKDLRLIPAALSVTATGTALTPGDRTRSHMLTSFATADALALIPPQGLDAGATCPFLELP